VVGNDEAGRRLEKLLKARRVTASLHRDRRVHTTQKLRVIARRQQLLRIDMEKAPRPRYSRSSSPTSAPRSQIATWCCSPTTARAGLEHIGVMIREARKAGKRVLVDPKGDDYARYKGASLLTPNLAELRVVVGSWKDEKDLAARPMRCARSSSSTRCC
jgi:bifunctional ADP-heptose synthase (sugar kinase/adenylyltransferase)